MEMMWIRTGSLNADDWFVNPSTQHSLGELIHPASPVKAPMQLTMMKKFHHS